MVMILSLGCFPDSLLVGFAGDFPDGRAGNAGSAATPIDQRIDDRLWLRPDIASPILQRNIYIALHKNTAVTP
jgi:hypothetical protein